MMPSHSNRGMTLALNAAEGMLQIAFADNADRLVYSQQIVSVSRGAEILTPALESAFSLLCIAPTDITRIAAVNGPGGFTGLRLAVTTAAGLARATGALQAPLDYMHLIARQCLSFTGITGETAHIWVLTRARRDLVYAQAFTRNTGATPPIHALTNLAVLPVSSGETARHIIDTGTLLKSSRILLAGSGVQANRNALIKSLAVPGVPRLTILPIESPLEETLLAAALEAQYGASDIEVAYVRRSDAEDNLPQIATRLGIDPVEAAEKLLSLTKSIPEK